MAIATADVQVLPPCPNLKAIRSLPPSQITSIQNKISAALLNVLSLSEKQFDKVADSCAIFVSSYARDNAVEMLGHLVFPPDSDGKNAHRHLARTEKDIRHRCLLVAMRIASPPDAGLLDVQTLLDIAVVYGRKNKTRIRELFATALRSRPSLLDDIKQYTLPSFSQLLITPTSALHAVRKTLFCVSNFLQCSPPEVVRVFSQSREFISAIAACYDERLTAISASYGGINLGRADETETSRMWVECKVACIDTFHVVLQRILLDVKEDPHVHSEHAIGVIFTLLEQSNAQSANRGTTPFLNRPLLVDYQQAYSLSSTLASVLGSNGNDDARLDVLDAALKSFDADSSRSAGALKILLHSAGLAPGATHQSSVSRGSLTPSRDLTVKGKGKAALPTQSPEEQLIIELGVSEVVSILPDYPESYIRDLLQLPKYAGKDAAEKVVSALLEGDAPSPEAARAALVDIVAVRDVPVTTAFTSSPKVDSGTTRRSEWGTEGFDPTKLSLGKKREEEETVLNDRSYFTDQMKADILRRAAELSDSDEEEVEVDEKGRKVKIVAFEEDDDDELAEGPVKALAGDENDSSDEEGTVRSEQGDNPDPEILISLAYVRTPNVFDRDAETRRSKARADLKAQTGWADEQIEGWRVMLERDPKKKAKLLQKFEHSGYRTPETGTGSRPHSSQGQASGSQIRGGRGRGRGRGGFNAGRGRGRGRGGHDAGAGTGESGGQDRAWKDKNKARFANHNRKRGHDKKMARGAAFGAPA